MKLHFLQVIDEAGRECTITMPSTGYARRSSRLS